MEIPELTPEQRGRFTAEFDRYWGESFGPPGNDMYDFAKVIWMEARALSEAIPYPCQKCGTPVVDVSSDGSVDVQCPKCGWIPVQVEEINGVPV